LGEDAIRYHLAHNHALRSARTTVIGSSASLFSGSSSMGAGKVLTRTKLAFGLLALCLLVGVIAVERSPSVNQQVAHANREMAYDLEPPTPQELQEATAAEHDRQRTIALNECVKGQLNSSRARRLEVGKLMEIVSACRVRILGPNNTPEAHSSMQVISPGHVETAPVTPLSHAP
jgi:hypothetical protein